MHVVVDFLYVGVCVVKLVDVFPHFFEDFFSSFTCFLMLQSVELSPSPYICPQLNYHESSRDKSLILSSKISHFYHIFLRPMWRVT